MIKVEQELIGCLSFCDTPIKNMIFQADTLILRIEVAYARVKDNEKLFLNNKTKDWLGEGVLIFKNWSSLNVLLYDQQCKNPVILSQENFEQLEDILIFERSNEHLKISGFGIKTGLWTEWNITDSKYYGEFEVYDNAI